VTESRRRGACPGLSAPMPTGDGLLARLMPAAPIPLGAMAGLCEAVRRHGNGVIEITARGSLQMRGLTPRSAPLFAAAVADLGIAAQEGVPVIAGFDDEAVDCLAAALRRAIGDARLALSPKVSVVVDDDGPLHLDAISADVRLRVVRSEQGPRAHLGIFSGDHSERTAHALPLPPKGGEGRGEGGVRRGQTQRCEGIVEAGSDVRRRGSISPGTDSQRALTPTLSPPCGEREPAAASGDVVPTTWLGVVAPEDAVRAVIDILGIIAAHGPAARVADIFGRAGVAAFRPVVTGVPTPAPPPRMPADMIGLHAMRDGTAAVGIAAAFGHTDADALEALVRAAARYGAQAVRPAPERALLLTGVSARDARDLIAAADRLGFVVRADDPRRRIAACPGAPACASGLIPARMLASTLAPALAPVLGKVGLESERGGVTVHISGCPKGCAHPGPAALTLVGTPEGCGVVHGGTARATPHYCVDPARLGDAMARLAANPREAAHG
jgi:precorrin-3B synthase